MPMETRGKGTGGVGSAEGSRGMTEGDLEIIAQRQNDKEARLRAEERELRRQREEFDVSRETLRAELKKELMEELAATMGRRETALPPESDRGDLTSPPRAPAAEYYHEYQPNTYGYSHHGVEMTDRHSAPRISFRDATETVPTFDGYNLPLSQFVDACRRARDMIPVSSEANLTRLLIGKLRNRAYQAVLGPPCHTVTQVIDALTSAFSIPMRGEQYRGELSAVYMKSGEHILDYVGRVRELRMRIIDAERRQGGLPSPHFLSDLEGSAIRAFCWGLPSDYKHRMKPEEYKSSEDAFIAARNIAQEFELDKHRYGHSPSYARGNVIHTTNTLAPRYPPVRRDPPPPRRDDQPPPRRETSNWRSVLPPRNDAWRSSPPRQHQDTRDIRTTRPPYRAPHEPRMAPQNPRGDTPPKICRYCKNVGHEIHECRKREYNNRLNNRDVETRETGNSRIPPGRTVATRTDEPAARPIRTIEATVDEVPASEH